MAEAWLRHWHGDQINAHSAGIEAHGLNPLAVNVMAEVGIDMSRQQSKTIVDISLDDMDLIISVCSHADQNCPILPVKTRKLHLGFDDPPTLARNASSEEQALSHYRRVRDEICETIKNIHHHI